MIRLALICELSPPADHGVYRRPCTQILIYITLPHQCAYWKMYLHRSMNMNFILKRLAEQTTMWFYHLILLNGQGIKMYWKFCTKGL